MTPRHPVLDLLNFKTPLISEPPLMVAAYIRASALSSRERKRAELISEPQNSAYIRAEESALSNCYVYTA